MMLKVSAGADGEVEVEVPEAPVPSSPSPWSFCGSFPCLFISFSLCSVRLRSGSIFRVFYVFFPLRDFNLSFFSMFLVE